MTALGLFDDAAPAKGNSGHSGYARNAHDWYVEPVWFVEALLNVEAFTGGVYDPCCGRGTIPLTCAVHGLDASGSDLVDRGYAEPQDFFRMRRRFDNIVSNPPFDRLEEFIHHSLRLTDRKVAVVAPITFVEGERRYRRLYQARRPRRIWYSPSRVPMPPGELAAPMGANEGSKGAKKAYAWFVWDQGYVGETMAGWLPPRSKVSRRSGGVLI